MSGTVWSQNPHLEPMLRELVAKGVSASGISRTLKVSRNAVIGKATRLGLVLKGTPTGTACRPRRRPGPAPVVETRDYALPSPPRRFSWQDEPHVR